jgi:hypothetical protein
LKQIIIINKIFQIEKIRHLKFEDYKIFAINYEIHRELDKIGINHIVADSLLSKKERYELYNFTISKFKWFKKNTLANNFTFEGINLFEITSLGQINENFLNMGIEGSIIKKIISKYNPIRIICSEDIEDFIKTNFENIKIEKISKNTKQELLYENIDFRFNIGNKSIGFNISKNNYLKLKNYFEKITYSTLNFWYKKSPKKIILMTEFNIVNYKKMILELNKDYQLVFLNFRRPTIWNFESLKVIKNSNSKIFNTSSLVNEHDVKLKVIKFQKKIDEIFNENFFEDFKHNQISFWPLIRKKLKNTISQRISDYIKQIMILKNILNKLDLEYVICLNEMGETEKILLKLNNQKIKSILLTKGFSQFHKETEEIRMRYDVMKWDKMISHKLFVWGEKDLAYSEKLGIKNSQIVISGNPKFDDFQVQTKKSKKKKIVLITPEPITELAGQYTTELGEKYEKTIRRIYQILKKYDDLEIIVKLHPGQNSHNKILKNIFDEVDSTIPVFQIRNSQELVNQCDLLMNITCEPHDASTIMLEGLIFNKPVLEISLNEEYSFSNVSIVTAFNDQNLESTIFKMLFDKQFLEKNAKNRNEEMKNYISYFKSSSIKISDYIKNWK